MGHQSCYISCASTPLQFATICSARRTGQHRFFKRRSSYKSTSNVRAEFEHRTIQPTTKSRGFHKRHNNSKSTSPKNSAHYYNFETLGRRAIRLGSGIHRKGRTANQVRGFQFIHKQRWRRIFEFARTDLWF